MILGIILITIGIIGSISTLIYGIKFMKKNNIFFKSDYAENVEKLKNASIVENKSRSARSKSNNNSKSKVKKKVSKNNKIDNYDTNGTELLEEIDNKINMKNNTSLDTEVLFLDNDTDILEGNNSPDTEILM